MGIAAEMLFLREFTACLHPQGCQAGSKQPPGDLISVLRGPPSPASKQEEGEPLPLGLEWDSIALGSCTQAKEKARVMAVSREAHE